MMSAALLLAACACASAPDPAPPGAYTPPADVGSLDCDQVRAEFMRLSVHVAAIARPEAAKLRRYQIVLGNEPAVPWPAVFLFMPEPRKSDLPPLKAVYDALSDVAIGKECAVAREL